MKPKQIVVLGYMGACPLAGVIWQHLHYIVGLQRLGHEVYYVEDAARTPYNPQKHLREPDYHYAANTLKSLGERFRFRDRWAFRARHLPERPTVGLSAARIRALYREADAVLNVCAPHELHEDLLEAERLILVESDPGPAQIRVDNEPDALLKDLASYRRLFTFGEHIGTELFPIPLHGLEWLPTRQPVVTAFWDTDSPPPAGAPFTTVTNWAASASFEWRGKTYLWCKALEFRRFADAPLVTGQPFELATDIPDADTRALFQRKGWRLAHPDRLNCDLDAYRTYVQSSKGEFTASKSIVVALNTGWFSDRSACYLAAGRPVLTQQTGFTRLYGGDRGLFGFTTIDEVAEALARIEADYTTHSDAAREIAKEYFEAEKVLKRLLDRANV
jgi:hypothetical protein